MILRLFLGLLLPGFFTTVLSMKSNPFQYKNDTFVIPNAKVTYSSAIGQCKRPYQEDCLATYKNEEKARAGFGIFDGHGGSDVSEKLADQNDGLVPTILKLDSPLSKQLIFEQFVKCDNDYFKNEGIDSGSTAVVLFVDSENIFMAHCGDSLGAIAGNRCCYYQTIPHLPTQESEKKRIKDAGGHIWFSTGKPRVRDRLDLTRSFGDSSLKGYKEDGTNVVLTPFLIISDPDVFQCPLDKLKKGEQRLALFCSDGFSDYFSSDSQQIDSSQFLNVIMRIAFLLLTKGRTVKTLPRDLIALMNWNKTLAAIESELKSASEISQDYIDERQKESSAQCSGDNVSLFVVDIEKNETAEPDSSDPAVKKTDELGEKNSKESVVLSEEEINQRLNDAIDFWNKFSKLSSPKKQKSFSAMIGQLGRRVLSLFPSSWTYRFGLVGGLLVVAYLVKWLALTRVA